MNFKYDILIKNVGAYLYARKRGDNFGKCIKGINNLWWNINLNFSNKYFYIYGF